MPIITIYQGASGSGQELAEAVGKSLGYRCAGRAELVAAARRYGVTEAKLNEIMEKGPRWWEPLIEDLRRYRIALQGGMCEIAQDGRIVYHGHLGHELLPGIRHVLKVLLTAPMENRIRQLQSRNNRGEVEARRYIEETDKARSRRLMSMFGIDWRDTSRFDLVLNAGRINIESAKHLIVEAAKLDEYRPTAKSEQQFQDLFLTARAHAVLITSREFRGSIFDVRSDRGHVHVSGNLRFGASEEQVVKVIENVPGVTKVTTDLGDIPLETA